MISFSLFAQIRKRGPNTLFYEAKTGVEIQSQENYRRLKQGPLDLGGSYLVGNRVIGSLYDIPLYLSGWNTQSIQQFAKKIQYIEPSHENTPFFADPYLVPKDYKLISIFHCPIDEAYYFQFRRKEIDLKNPAMRLGVVARKVENKFVAFSFMAEEPAFICGERWLLRLIETAVEPLAGFKTRFSPIFPFLTASMEALSRSHILWSLFDIEENYGSDLLLYRLEDADSTVYLLASVHAGISSFYPLPNEAISAFESCKNLIFESVPENNTLWELRNYNASLEKYQTGENLLSYVDTSTVDEISNLITTRIFNIPQEQILYQKPWVLYTFVSSLLSRDSGVESRYGIENYFLSIKRPWQELKGLEEVKYHLATLDRISADYWIKELLELDEEASLKEVLEMMEKWRLGDEVYFSESVKKDRDENHPSYFKYMLEERNERMVKSIIRYLDTNEDCFILAGTAHFCGPTNIIDLLKRDGFNPIQVGMRAEPLKKD